ncbi:MAG: hypothetical protein AAFO29_25785, partial [Actinomycetota bacterium]
MAVPNGTTETPGGEAWHRAAPIVGAILGLLVPVLFVVVAGGGGSGSSVDSDGDGLLPVATTLPPPGSTSDREAPDGIVALEQIGLSVDPRSSQRPWSDIGAIDGLLTFRGNPTRTFHGRGPVPDEPEVLWSRTIGCSNSSVGGEAKVWCGTGWTGQPAVFPAPDGDGWWVGVG